MSEEDKIAKISEWEREDFEKLLLLCDVYNIETDEYMYNRLALSLARDFVPGFKERRQSGPAAKWSHHRLGVLVVEIERIVKDRSCSISTAAEVLSTREPWLSFATARESGDTPNRRVAIKKQYNRFRQSKHADAYRVAFKYCVATDQLDLWNDNLDDL